MPAAMGSINDEAEWSEICLRLAEDRTGLELKCSDLPFISWDRDIQVEYWEMRLKGGTHNLSKMCVLRSPPAIVTDQQFNMGRVNNNQFARCPELGKLYREEADRQGISTTGKYYVHGLGRYPGDPRAWCRGRGDVLAIAKERNLSISGLVEHKGHAVEPTPDVPLAEDLWENATQEVLEANPDMRYEDAREKAFSLRAKGDRPKAETSFGDVSGSFEEALKMTEEA